MRTLDLTPLMTAMRSRPGEFEMNEPWLRHRASGHAFLILNGTLARIQAPCSCGELVAEPSQTAEFVRVLNAWTMGYWRPLQITRAAERRAAEINRQFAAHFRPPGRWTSLARRVACAWRAAVLELRRPAPEPLAVELLPPEEQTTTATARPAVNRRQTVDA